MPKITIVVPVYDRPAELQRALGSVRTQTFTDFECLVVDDASTLAIEPAVSAIGDPRFCYLRNARNGGPYNARTVGYRRMRGEYLLHLDSDWELYPWTLARAVHYLDEYPNVDAVSGMHVRQSDLSMFVRVGLGKQIVNPKEYLAGKSPPDCVGAVRRLVVEEWLAKRTDYFAMEFHQWFTFGLHHSQLYVDEPWTRYHVDAKNRVSTAPNPRRLDDYLRFIEEHDGYLRSIDAPFLTELLFGMWFDLARAGRKADSRRVRQYLKLGSTAVAMKLARKIGARVAGIGRRGPQGGMGTFDL
jgi:glycosyltransferase involved in cell wall biosynthesis